MRQLRIFLGRFRLARVAYARARGFTQKIQGILNTRSNNAHTDQGRRHLNEFLKGVDLSQASGLRAFERFVDKEFIQKTYGVDPAQVEGIVHDLIYSTGESAYDPNEFFDSDFYFRNNWNSIVNSGFSPFIHFIIQGRSEGLAPSPLFTNGDQWNSTESLHGAGQRQSEPVFEYLFGPREAASVEKDVRSVAGHVDPSRVALVIPVFNNWLWTERCLRAVLKTGDISAENIWIIDDASSDGTLHFLKKRFPEINVLSNQENLGFLRSCNKAYEQLKDYPYIFLLNNDTEPQPGFLTKSLKLMMSDSDIAIVASKLLNSDATIQDAGGIIWRDASGWNYGGKAKPNLIFNVRREIDYATGAAMLLRRSQVGDFLFDELFAPAYYEDTDLSFRVRAENHRVVYCPESKVIHHEGKSHGTDVTTGLKSFQEINKLKFREKWKTELQKHAHADVFSLNLAAFRLELLSKPKTILWLDYQLPNPTRDSGSVRAVSLMNTFQNEGFLIIFVPENGDVVQLSPNYLTSLGILVARNLTEARQILNDFRREPDLVFSSRVYTSSNIGMRAKSMFPKSRFVFDTVDLHFLRLEREFQHSRNLVVGRSAETTRKEELSVIAKSDATIVVSDVEKKLLNEILPSSHITVISNIHDVRAKGEVQNKKGLVFVGSFNHHPNGQGVQWLLQHVWPLLTESSKNEGLIIIGQNPPDWLIEFQDSRVRCLGWVEDSGEFVREAKVSVAPLLVGAGVKGKVGEAIANFTPVVGTEIALEGMHLQNGVSAMFADSPEDFAAAIELLLTTESLRVTLAKNAEATLVSQFSSKEAQRRVRELMSHLGLD